MPLPGCVLTVVTTTLALFTNPAFKSTPTPRARLHIITAGFCPRARRVHQRLALLPTLGPRRQVGEAGASGLDVGGLEGGQDEGHLPAIGGQLGQQVVLRRRPPGPVRLLPRRPRRDCRHLERDHFATPKGKSRSWDREPGDAAAELRRSKFTLSLLLLHALPQQVPAAVFKALHGCGWREVRGQLIHPFFFKSSSRFFSLNHQDNG